MVNFQKHAFKANLKIWYSEFHKKLIKKDITKERKILLTLEFKTTFFSVILKKMQLLTLRKYALDI